MTTTLTVNLIGVQSPKRAQIVVADTPSGDSFSIIGTADGYTWNVPGAVGTGDGGVFSCVDNRAPLNVPIIYSLVTSAAAFAAAPVTIPGGTCVFETLDGSVVVSVVLLDGSLDRGYDVNQAVFHVPGRARPVVRYTTMGDGGGTIQFGASTDLTPTIEGLFRGGASVLMRLGEKVVDLPPASVILATGLASKGYSVGYRVWSVPFLIVDDPYLDRILGGFSWDAGFDATLAGGDWDDRFDGLLAGLSWDEFDTLDWSTM